jgi:3-oxoacyl-[acyl-carrier-protein] synthase III
MKFSFSNKEITGILSILPSREIIFKDEISNYNFTEKQSLKLSKIMGYGSRRVVQNGTTVSDLCIHGLNYLINDKSLDKESIDALILVTQTPDYFLPPTSNIIAGSLDLGEDVLCLDINQGCAGYEVGLLQAYMLLEQMNINKVVLLNADILSTKVSEKDRNSKPLVGDGATITIVESKPNINDINLYIKMDGKGAKAIQIPAGAFKQPSTKLTANLTKDKSGNERSLDDLVMKGDDVFNFVQTKVPQMVNDIFKDLSISDDNIDYYLFHQPNKFMLEKLADKMSVKRDKMPNNIVGKYGNGSGITVPLNICENLNDKLDKTNLNVILGGFGVGLTWSMIVCVLKKMKFCKIINY